MSSAALMSAVPVVDKKDGYLIVKNMNGTNYIKLWDPKLNATLWQPVPPNVQDLIQININGVSLTGQPPETGATAATTTSGQDPFSKLGSTVQAGQQAGLTPTTSKPAAPSTTTTLTGKGGDVGQEAESTKTIQRTIGGAPCRHSLPLASISIALILAVAIWL